MMSDKTKRSICEHSNQRGHIELGITLAIWIILGAIAFLSYTSDGEPFEMWLSWPWWVKGFSIVGIIAILLIGRIFENSRQWPKLPPDDEHQ